MSSPTSTKTIAFFGASGGCGLAALKRAVAAGHTCIALCRNPAKLGAVFPEKPANLIVKAGNAHVVADVAACLTKPNDPTKLVDKINVTLGSPLDMKKMTTEDPDVCKKGMATLLEGLKQLRNAADGRAPAEGETVLAVISTTGISEHQKDVPLMFRPMYTYMLKVPHADKKVMETMLHDSPERWVIIRPSFLVEGAKPSRKIRVGVEDPKLGVEKKEVGYGISRDDVGRWMFDNLLQEDNLSQYEGKAVSITW